MPQPSKNAVGSRKHSSLGKSAVLGIDPSPFCVQTAVHTGLGTGIFFAITLVIGAIALAAYSYFRLHRRTTGFQRFEVRARKMGTCDGGPLCNPALGAGQLQPTAASKNSPSRGARGTHFLPPRWGLCPSEQHRWLLQAPLFLAEKVIGHQ